MKKNECLVILVLAMGLVWLVLSLVVPMLGVG